MEQGQNTKNEAQSTKLEVLLVCVICVICGWFFREIAHLFEGRYNDAAPLILMSSSPDSAAQNDGGFYVIFGLH